MREERGWLWLCLEGAAVLSEQAVSTVSPQRTMSPCAWCVPKALPVRGETGGGKKQKGRSEELVFPGLRLHTVEFTLLLLFWLCPGNAEQILLSCLALSQTAGSQQEKLYSLCLSFL